jgi:general secretion pathway protein G
MKKGNPMPHTAPQHQTAKGHPSRTKAEAGFTLVELLVVLVILSLLAALVGPRVVGYMGQSKVKAAHIQIDGFQTALDLFQLDVGRYPLQSEGLDALVAAPAGATGWAGPYLDKGITADPWGAAYIYKAEGNGAGFQLLSLGADGREGGDAENADIGN